MEIPVKEERQKMPTLVRVLVSPLVTMVLRSISKESTVEAMRDGKRGIPSRCGQFRRSIGVSRAVLGGLVAAGALWGAPVYNFSVIAQLGQVVAGHTLTTLGSGSGYGGIGIAPDNNFVAYLAGYANNTGQGIFGSNGALLAYKGEQIGALTINPYILYGPYVNDSDHVLFEAYTPSWLSVLTDSSVLLTGSSGAAAASPMLLTNSGDYLGLQYGNSGYYIANASGPVAALNPTALAPQWNQVGGNQNGGAVYVGTNYMTSQNEVFAKNGTVIAKPGTVIGGHTIDSVMAPAAVNDSGTIVFAAYYDGGKCGIFTQSALAVKVPSNGGCIVLNLNINSSGSIAYVDRHTAQGGNETDLLTQDGLVAANISLVGAEFYNNLGSLAFRDGNGNVELATNASTPEPATWLLTVCALFFVIGVGRPACVRGSAPPRTPRLF
jgi:hypothetical protein